MGEWDVYCAICGGPFVQIDIASKPRSARFQRRRAREAEKRVAEGIPDDESVHVSSEDEDMNSGEEYNAEDDDVDSEEDRSYDPDVISLADTEWTKTLRVIGFNPNGSNGLSKYILPIRS